MLIFNKLKANLVQSLIGLGLFFVLILLNTLLFQKDRGLLSEIGNLFYLAGAVLLILYIRSCYTNERLLPKFGLLNLATKIRGFLLSALIFLSLFYGLDYIQSAPGALVTLKDAFKLTVILTVFVQVFMEEIIFRYYMSGTLTGKMDDTYIYIFTSSIAFSILHAFSYNHYLLVYIFFYGIAFGMLYLLTKNIGVPIGLHFANNYYIEINADGTENIYTPGSFTELFKDNLIIIIIICLIYTCWVLRNYVFKKDVASPGTLLLP